MPPDPSVQLQADAHAALLDVLEVERAVVYAGSAGGTSALQLAIRHPGRVAGLVLQSTNVPGPHHDKAPVPPAVARRLWGSDMAMWLVRTYLSGWILQLMGVPKDLTLTAADRARVELELDGIFPVSERIEGIVFDAFTGNPDINNDYAFGAITAPTLLVHFEDDGGPPYPGAVALAGQIPGARLLSGEHGGHLGLGEHPGITAGIDAFLEEVVPR
jgi:pimeloyl-ACP methyl ester carboxylesterase